MQATRRTAQRAAAQAARLFATGPAGSCSGVPEEIFQHKARAFIHTWLSVVAAQLACGCLRVHELLLGLCLQVTIFAPARSACQQGKGGQGTWKIAFGEQQRCVPSPCLSLCLRAHRADTPVEPYAPLCLPHNTLTRAWASSSRLSLSIQVGEPAHGMDQHRRPALTRRPLRPGV